MLPQFASEYIMYSSTLPTYTWYVPYCNRLFRWYFENKNNKEKTQQLLQWAGTDDGRPGQHQTFSLMHKRVCSKAICTLVGISPQTWTARVRQKSEEIHYDRLHGNTVRTLGILPIRYQKLIWKKKKKTQ